MRKPEKSNQKAGYRCINYKTPGKVADFVFTVVLLLIEFITDFED